MSCSCGTESSDFTGPSAAGRLTGGSQGTNRGQRPCYTVKRTHTGGESAFSLDRLQPTTATFGTIANPTSLMSLNFYYCAGQSSQCSNNNGNMQSQVINSAFTEMSRLAVGRNVRAPCANGVNYKTLTAAGSFMLNIMNEWGHKTINAKSYADQYNGAIRQIRSYYGGPIIIDLPGYGQLAKVAADAVTGAGGIHKD
jgi:hypothetical protein